MKVNVLEKDLEYILFYFINISDRRFCFRDVKVYSQIYYKVSKLFTFSIIFDFHGK